MYITGHSEFARELAKALGFDPAKVQSITLHCHAKDVVMAVASVYVHAEEGAKIVALCNKYLSNPAPLTNNASQCINCGARPLPDGRDVCVTCLNAEETIRSYVKSQSEGDKMMDFFKGDNNG